MNDEQDDFWVDWSMHIGEVKMFHVHLCYAIETWPGSPRRPVEEQEFLKFMRSKTFAMLMEYQMERPSYENDD